MRALADAQRDVLDAVPRLPAVPVPIEGALGLVLAEAVVAAHDLPPFPNSAMDGYAVRHEDVAVAPVDLPVLEDVPAGSVPTMAVRPGTAIKIMTGAPMPDGADTIVRVEDTEAGRGRVTIMSAPDKGTAVRAAGGDVRAGSVVIEPGVRLAPAHLGILSSLGATRPVVSRRPRVALMSTGDEVVPPETADLAPGKIRDSNRFVLRGLLEDAGAEVLDLGIVGDEADLLRATLERAADTADVVVTSGGVSVGEYDLVKQELARLGTIDFWQVAMQPAKPFAFGSIGAVPLFGLPGNPVSAFVAFEQFLRPGLLQMMGAHRLFRPQVAGLLDEAVDTDPEKTVFVRVITRSQPHGPFLVRRSGGQGSNVLSALAAADAFGVVPVGVSSLDAGEQITLELFRAAETRTRKDAIDG
jgi:molybdopterin molybdotransferase